MNSEQKKDEGIHRSQLKIEKNGNKTERCSKSQISFQKQEEEAPYN